MIRTNVSTSLESDEHNLRYWQDELFCNFLVYCLPISLIALLPGVFMALRDGVPIIAGVDLLSFGLIMVATFAPKIKLLHRKICVITVFYFLAVFLINTLGYIGPGIFYLFFITLLTALVFPVRYAYLSVLSNIALLGSFALIIEFKLFHSALLAEYTTGKWIAFSSNLVFASTVIVLLIDRIFMGLQLTIDKKTHLQERYQHIFYRSPMPMWLFDTDTFAFIDVNDAAVKQYGYTKEEFLQMSIMDIRQKETIAQTEQLVNTNKISGQYYSGISCHIKKDGEMIYVNVESNLLNLDGRKVRLVQALDITTQLNHQVEIFEANLKIEESEANLRAIFDSALDGFVLLDKRYKIKLFNPKASEAMKFNKGQMPFEIGQSIFEYVHSSLVEQFRDMLTKVYAGATEDYDQMFRTPGKINWIRYTLTPVFEDQRIVGACITGRDITARKLYLRSVEEQNKTFREISWMQSHLVRAPLARIMGLLPMLSNADSDEERAEIIGYLNLSAQELDSIILKITQKSNRIMQKNNNPNVDV